MGLVESFVCMLSCSVMSTSLWPHGLQPSRLLGPWDFPGKNTEVGCHFLLQGIFPTQGSNLGLLLWQVNSLPLSHLGSPLSLKWGGQSELPNIVSRSLFAPWETPWPKEKTHWKSLWCWEGLGAGGEGDNRGWDGWMASPTRWTWVWVNSGSWWWTGRPGVLQFMGSQRVGHDWATELSWTESKLWASATCFVN